MGISYFYIYLTGIWWSVVTELCDRIAGGFNLGLIGLIWVFRSGSSDLGLHGNGSIDLVFGIRLGNKFASQLIAHDSKRGWEPGWLSCPLACETVFL